MAEGDPGPVLRALRLGGVLASTAIAVRTGLDPQTVTVLAAGLAAEGAVRDLGGSWALTDPGRSQAEAIMRDPLGRDGARERLEEAYVKFRDLDGALKSACTRWQLRTDGAPNDHGDERWDAQVIADVAAIDRHAQRLLGELTAIDDSFGCISRRLTSALARAGDGDPSWLTGIDGESYHMVWYEWHEQMLVMLDQQRSNRPW